MGAFFESLFSVTDVTLLGGAVRFAAGFTDFVTAICAVCLFFAATNFFYSAVSLHHDMVLRMVSAVRTGQRSNTPSTWAAVAKSS